MSIKSLSVVSCENFVFLSSSLPLLCWLSLLIYVFLFFMSIFLCVYVQGSVRMHTFVCVCDGKVRGQSQVAFSSNPHLDLQVFVTGSGSLTGAWGGSLIGLGLLATKLQVSFSFLLPGTRPAVCTVGSLLALRVTHSSLCLHSRRIYTSIIIIPACDNFY